MQPPRRFASAVTVPALLLLACVPPKGQLGEYTGGDTTGDTTVESGGGGGTDGTTTATDTGPDTSEGATTTGAALPHCMPPSDMTESFELTFDPPLLEGAFDGECLVSDDEGAHVFTCGEQQIELFMILGHQPTPAFGPGNTVWFSYRAQLAFGERAWFSIRGVDQASLLLGGVSAETLVPPGEPEFFAPLALVGVTGVCAPPVDCSSAFEQLEVAASLDGQTVQLGAGEFDQVGDAGYDVSVMTARRLHNDLPDGQGGTCSVSDVPEFFYRVLLRRP